ncbi:ion channel [Aliiruegeria haliotis]|uniref:Ion channel n=1 Tax=Aliiruegeria haliotis TaxID=1280846 RepID=A0A2T0RF95_9RHOB|nr:potassium channel family protein [Aliiruegeria haliotis]PRY19770.1 ion channel [Aliiruegeria haliotis]
MLPLGLTILRLLKAIARSWSVPSFRAGFALAILILFSGTVFNQGAEGWSWVDSLYFSATTISTVGLGDLSPQTELGKVFTVVYIFVGVGVFVALFCAIRSGIDQPGKRWGIEGRLTNRA